MCISVELIWLQIVSKRQNQNASGLSFKHLCWHILFATILSVCIYFGWYRKTTVIYSHLMHVWYARVLYTLYAYVYVCDCSDADGCFLTHFGILPMFRRNFDLVVCAFVFCFLGPFLLPFFLFHFPLNVFFFSFHLSPVFFLAFSASQCFFAHFITVFACSLRVVAFDWCAVLLYFVATFFSIIIFFYFFVTTLWRTNKSFKWLTSLVMKYYM